MDISKLASGIVSGERRAIARGITLVENDPKGGASLLELLRPPLRAFIVGVTGPPGTGKSTLVDRLIGLYRQKGLKVGVVAVDPTSPLTGGALLGDRVRMEGHGDDQGVFIRSMATRGWSGGLSRAASQAIQVLDSARFDIIFLETVGIGQSDIEVVSLSHATVVVLMPGLGDEVQVSKAGLMEVGDIYAVNKADIEGADAMVVNLLGMVRTKSRPASVIKVSARSGEGLDKLESAIESIRSRFTEGVPDLRLRSVKGMILESARADALDRFRRVPESKIEILSKMVLAGKITVFQAARSLTN